MDRQQAKEILQLYRPWVPDREDPDMAEAIELSKHDPELARWLEEHCALQESIRAKFSETAVPEGLMEQILSERKAHLDRGRQRKAVLAAAMAVALFMFIGILNHYRQATEDKNFPAFRHYVAGLVL